MKKIRPLIIIVSTIVCIMALYNKIIDFLANFSHQLLSVNQFYYRWKFGEVAYTKNGQGSPVLLIHDPMCGSSDFEFQSIITDLSKKHTVYTLDLLGYGRSSKPKMTYTAFIYVQLINDFIKDIIKSPTQIIASGDSSLFVMLLTLLSPQSIKNIILVSPGSVNHYLSSPTKWDRFMKEIIELPLLGTFIYNILTIRPFLKGALLQRLTPSYYVKKRQVDGLFESSHMNGSGAKFTYLSWYFHFMKSDIRKALKQSSHSIYIVTGNQLPEAEAILQDYMEINPAIEYTLIPDSKYYPHLEQPQSFMEICTFFFES